MSSVEYGNIEWAITYAREYCSENQAKDALRILADEITALRAENRVYREMIGHVRRELGGIRGNS